MRAGQTGRGACGDQRLFDVGGAITAEVAGKRKERPLQLLRMQPFGVALLVPVGGYPGKPHQKIALGRSLIMSAMRRR